MARCPDCNKFVSNGDPEVSYESGEDELDVQLDEEGLQLRWAPEVLITIPCGDCGTELKNNTFSLEIEETHQCDKLPKELPDDFEIPELSADDPEPTDDYQTKDRKGRVIKNPRYQKHLYGVSVHATTKCPFCEAEIEFNGEDQIEASGMNDCT